MSEAPRAPADTHSIAGDLSSRTVSPTPNSAQDAAAKRSAAEAFDVDSVEDLNDRETTLDDVLVSPVAKRTKLLDADLPDVDDNEQFPQEDAEMDAELELGLQDEDKQELQLFEGGHNQDQVVEEGQDAEGELSDVDALAPPEDEDEDTSEPPTSQNNEIDIVDVEEDEEEVDEDVEVDSSGPGQYSDEEDEDEHEHETARAVARAENQREARQLLQQLDDSARSKLCLMALEKYGEELFFGHEDARDAILVDACAQDSILSLMRDAIRVRELYARGSAAAPVELDDDDDDDEEETGGYEDEEEEEEADEEEEKPPASGQEDDAVVIISEEEEEEEEEEEAKSDGGNALSPSNEGPAEKGARNDDELEEEEERTPNLASDADENEQDGSEENEGEEHESAAVSDVGTAGDLASEAPHTDTATAT